MDRDERRDRRVEEGLRDLVPVGIENRVGEHVVADVAHQHQAAPVHASLAAGRCGVDAVRIEAALDGAAAFREALHEVAPHQAEPVAVDLDLVVRVHGRDAVLEIHDGRDGGFQHDVGQAGRVVRADRARAVEDDLDVQAIVAQQRWRWATSASPR